MVQFRVIRARGTPGAWGSQLASLTHHVDCLLVRGARSGRAGGGAFWHFGFFAAGRADGMSFTILLFVGLCFVVVVFCVCYAFVGVFRFLLACASVYACS